MNIKLVDIPIFNEFSLILKHSQYDQYKTPMENIGLQDSLLSRFDLLFVMLDTIDGDNDKRIADFVVRMHRYRNPKEQDGGVLPMGGSYAEFLTTFNLQNETETTKEMQIYEKYDALLHGDSRTRSEQILSVQFMRKYIHLAKCLKPRLTQEASDVIANEYSRLRSQDLDDTHMARTQPVTARTLETLIRLSTAHAKARMAKTIAVADAKAAIELVQFAYFKKVLEKEKRKRRRSEDGESDEEIENDHDQNGDADENTVSQVSQGTRKSKRTKIADASETMDTDDIDDMTVIQPVDAGDLTKRTTRKSVGKSTPSTATDSAPSSSSPDFISQDRLLVFKQKLNQAFCDVREQTLAVEALTGAINQNIEQPFSPAEVNAAIELMSEANQIMVADGIVFLI